MRILPLLLSGILSIFASESSIAQALQCTDITRALKEFSISTSSTSYLNSVFDSYCEASGSSKGSNAGIGLEAVVKAIPIKFTGSYSSTEEAMRNFCKTYASSSSLQTRNYTYEEKVAGKAMDTVAECLRLQSQNVLITHTVVNNEQVAFYLKSAVAPKIKISGVSVTGNISCSGVVAGKSVTFNDSTYLTVEDTQNFTCRRGSDPSSSNPNIKVYREATIVVSTNFNNYSVFWPRDERLPEDMASTISQNLDNVKNQTQEAIDGIIHAKTLPVYQCPVGTAGWNPGGAWGSYGCQGQLSTTNSCQNYEYPSHQERDCPAVGVLRLF
jgi:hypothetical protein